MKIRSKHMPKSAKICIVMISAVCCIASQRGTDNEVHAVCFTVKTNLQSETPAVRMI